MANLKYLLIRLALFVVALLICLWLGTGLIFGGIFSALIAFAVSYLFFSRQRDDAAVQLASTIGSRQRAGRAEKDAAAEDAEVSRSQQIQAGPEGDRRADAVASEFEVPDTGVSPDPKNS